MATRLLPRTNSRVLSVALLLIVLLCALLAASEIVAFVKEPGWGQLIMSGLWAVFWTVLGLGLWKLNPIARNVALFLSWLVVVFLPLGIFNPLMMADMAANGRELNVWRAVLWIAPLVATALAVLYVLSKYRTEFGKGGDAL